MASPAAPAGAADLVFLGNRARILADGATTAGALGLVEMALRPGDMPPLHVHPRHDEGWYVIDGEITLYTPGATTTARAGDYAVGPRGVPHTYRAGDAGARVLVTSTPAGFERFVAEVAALAEVDPAVLTEVAARHDIEILGPPGMLPDAAQPTAR
jgi:quercetin dioxygenase-like cupin family protein